MPPFYVSGRPNNIKVEIAIDREGGTGGRQRATTK